MNDLFSATIGSSVDANSENETLLPHFDLDSFLDKTYLTHNLHPYPAKFVPQIPRLLIDRFCPGAGTVFDPFCGSGTSLVEAALSGRRALGTDLHPLAVLLSRAKTTVVSPGHVRELRSFLSRISLVLRRDEALNGFEPPEFHNRSKWFTDEALTELAFLKGQIQAVETSVVKNILMVCFSAIIVKASNQESDTRWKAVDKGRRRGDTLRFFVEKLESSIARLIAFSEVVESSSVKVDQANAKDLSPIPSESIDFLVTSPPYMNSYDYYLYHKLRMFWLGFDHYAVQEQEIGSRNKHCDNGLGLEEYVKEIEATMREARRVLKKGSFAVYVIGDSILRSELVKMDECYCAMASNAGFSNVDKFSFDQRRYTKAFTGNYKTQVKQSHILLFRSGQA